MKRSEFLRASLALAAPPTLLLASCQTPAGNRKRAGRNPLAVAEGPGANTAGLDRPTWNQAGSQNLPTAVGTRDTYNRVGTNLPFVALTYDDGPHPSHTPRLLDMLKARNVKATFYVIESNCKRHPDILRRMLAEGHEIGNHSATHPNLARLSADQVRRELRVTHETITSTTGVAPRTMRPPYGALTTAQRSWVRQEFGYPTIMWSVDPEDWRRPGASVVTNRVVSGASPGGILLLHDIHASTIDASPGIMDQLLAKGYQFVTVSQLIAMDGRA